jgi:[methyl-Co(III) methanol-specific corrinoid protein]:coenzyme M methyltransferase
MEHSSMQTKERFINALYGRPVDRPPVACVATGITVEMQERRGIFWPEAHRRAESLAGLAEAIHLFTDTECIKLPFCMTVEVEALGANVDYRTKDTIPTETHHIWNHPGELKIHADFFDRGRVPVVLNAVSELRRRYDQEVPIVASIVGPFSLASKLFGFDNFLVWIVQQPEWVHTVMEALTPLATRYAQALVEAGADAIIVGEAGSSGDLISGAMYGSFIAPYHAQLCPAIPAPTILHICGKSTRHTKHIADTGATAYNFDEGVDIHAARQNMSGRVRLTGWVPTVKVLLNGTPDDAYASAITCLEAGVDVLTPGCALAPHTPIGNIQAMVAAVHDWNNRRLQAASTRASAGSERAA